MDALRGYATDRDDYQKLIALEESMANAPRFLFNVTIQNHGGYSAPGDTPITADLSHYGDYPEAELYLSLVTLSDPEGADRPLPAGGRTHHDHRVR